MPSVTFDPAKDVANRTKHGISLDRFQDLDLTEALVTPAKTVRGETRVKLLGRIDGRLWAAVVAARGDETRVISLRPASRTERRTYADAHTTTTGE